MVDNIIDSQTGDMQNLFSGNVESIQQQINSMTAGTNADFESIESDQSAIIDGIVGSGMADIESTVAKVQGVVDIVDNVSDVVHAVSNVKKIASKVGSVARGFRRH